MSVEQLIAESPSSSNNSSNFTSPPLRPPRSISKANSKYELSFHMQGINMPNKLKVGPSSSNNSSRPQQIFLKR